MLIDIHAHLWGNTPEQSKKEVITACERYGIDKVCISVLENLYPDKAEVDRMNRELYRFMEEYDRVIGFVYIDPSQDNALQVLQEGLAHGVKGIKLWVATYCNDPCVFPVIEKAIELELPVMIHTWKKSVGQLRNETTGTEVADLARRYPQAKLIMAHLGGNCYHGVHAIRDCKNVCTDFSGSIYKGDELAYTLEMLGAERVLFGSDMPGSFLVNLGQVEDLPLTADQKDLIYYKNALRLLNLEA